jgi:hypothetical protein
LDSCFVQPAEQPFSPFFGFATFITALTLIALVFTISDTRYRFRIAIAPLPLIPISFWVSAGIGFMTLVSDVWFSERWPIPDYLQSQALWQGALGSIFLLLVLVWMYFAFLNPATFGRTNAKRYINVLFRVVVRGDDAELPIIANELAFSARKIIDFCRVGQSQGGNKSPDVADYAHDLLLLIGSRKLCRHIVASAPGTAIALFQRMSETQKYELPVRQLATNLSTEAIQNTDSILYHEDEGFSSGLLGYVKPFSAAIYGDYRLVEGLGQNFGSPLDVDYKAVGSWNSQQLSAFCRASMMTFRNYLHIGAWRTHSYSLARAFDCVQNAFSDAYKLNDPQTPYFPSDILSRVEVAVRFVKSAVDEIGKTNPVPNPIRLRKRMRNGAFQLHDMYDEVADLMFQLVLAASYVTSETDRSWAIQHNTVWTNFFSFTTRNGAWPIVQFKLRRLIFDEITDMSFLNYKSARVLGFSLNVLGFTVWQGQDPQERRLQRALLAWTKKNYLRLWRENPEVAVSGLPASLTFDVENKRLVKTYIKGLEREAPKVYLELDG